MGVRLVRSEEVRGVGESVRLDRVGEVDEV